MKTLLLITSLLSSLTASAINCPSHYLERQVKQPSRDRRLKISFIREIALGESLLNNTGEEFFFNDYRDQMIEYYRATGSEHSGWFELALIVDKRSCNILEEITLYSE